MDEQDLGSLLESVRTGEIPVTQALAQLRARPDDELGFAVLDHQRARRTLVPEVVFCQGKTADQLVQIVGRMLEREGRVLATHAAPEAALAVVQAYPTVRYEPLPRILVSGDHQDGIQEEGAPYVAVATGGTSDIPVAEEAALTLEFLGDRVQRIYDVGVAGIHRLLARRDALAGARTVIAVAGMEGALPSVIAGMVACPLVAVPTSVGYGASLGGLAALLAMLNSCAPGVAVVNIDNGFGAAVHAHHIMRIGSH